MVHIVEVKKLCHVGELLHEYVRCIEYHAHLQDAIITIENTQGGVTGKPLNTDISQWLDRGTLR
jgi:hypothetical protein